MPATFNVDVQVGNNSNQGVMAYLFNREQDQIDRYWFGNKDDFRFEFFRSDEAKAAGEPIDTCQVLYKNTEDTWTIIYYVKDGGDASVMGQNKIVEIIDQLYNKYYLN